MAQNVKLSFKGLYTDSNDLSSSSVEGGLLIADNIVIDAPNVVTSRRGQRRYATKLNTPIDDLITFNNNLMVYSGHSLYYDNNESLTQISGTYQTPVDTQKLHYVEANKNLYFTDQTGVLKLDSLDSSPTLAGVPRALDGLAFVAGTSGFLEDKKQVVYRIVYGTKDKNFNLILGAPSSRIYALNTSGTASDVQLKFTLPFDIDDRFFYQVYRTKKFDYDPPDDVVNPDDELQLVLENPVTAQDIVNQYIEIIDNTPENLRGAFLYSSQSQEGASEENRRPPMCKDMAYYKDSVWFANTRGVESFTTSLLGTGGVIALNVGDTVTIGDATYTAALDENSSNNEFKLFNVGDISGDIEDTVKSLVRVINTSPNNTQVYAYYASLGEEDLAGRFVIEARSNNSQSINISSSNPTSFYPELKDGTTSESNIGINRLYFSKAGIPEAVPLTNYFDIGRSNFEIKRIIALRDSLFIFKEDGIFRLSGEDKTSYYVRLFDGTATLVASETAVAFNNQIFAISDQGIVMISETGVGVISYPLESVLFKLTQYSNFSRLAFGVAYGSDRKYILFCPETEADTTCTQAFVFNTFTQTFVRWPLNRSCGIIKSNVDKQGEMFLGTSSGFIYKERKNFSLDDYADDDYTVVITQKVSDFEVMVDSISDEINVGFSLKQGTKSALITAIDRDHNILTVVKNLNWLNEVAGVYSPIVKKISWFPIQCGNPAVLKHFRDITFLFLDAPFNDMKFLTSTDISIENEETIIKSQPQYPWGYGSWGKIPWGGGLGGKQAIRSYIPLEKSRGRWLNLSIEQGQAFNQFSVSGVSLMYSFMSERDK